jgi:hypothetical protein
MIRNSIHLIRIVKAAMERVIAIGIVIATSEITML